MSRGLNRDTLPLHKPEACSTILNGQILRVEVACTLIALLDLMMILLLQWKMRWSLTYVATPIAVAVREVLFTSSGLTNSTGRCVQPPLQCTASLC